MPSGRLVARYYDPRFGRFLQQDPLPDVVEQARARAVAALSYETLAAAPASWTSGEFAAREEKLDLLTNSGFIHTKLRAFEWLREELPRQENTGSTPGNQAGVTHRAEPRTKQSGFTGAASGGALSGGGPAFSLPAIGPSLSLDPQALNLYAYATNNPLRYTDPDGKKWEVKNKNGEVLAEMSDSRFDRLRGKADDRYVFRETKEGYDVYRTDEQGRFNPDKDLVGTARQTSVDLGEDAQIILGETAKKCGGSGDALALALAEFAAEEAISAATGMVFAKVGGKVIRYAIKSKKGQQAIEAVSRWWNKVDDKLDEAARVETKAGADATKSRVKLRKRTVEQVQANQPRNEVGEMVDPNTGQTLKPQEVDVGHKPGQEWRTRRRMHQQRGSTRREVIEAENDPDLYHLEDRSSNRSHRFEEE